MIEKILEFWNKRKGTEELEELQKEYSQMREALLFNLRTTDSFVAKLEMVLDSDELYYDQKSKIKELLKDFTQKKL